MNRKIAVLLIAECLTLVTFAQKPKVKNDPNHDKKPVHFGFSLGLNFMDYRIEHTPYAASEGVLVELNGLSPGINIHAIANFRLGEYFDLRTLPGISFGERFIYFVNYNNENIYTEGEAYKAESSYLEFPVLLKYKSKRLNNFRPYLIGGGNLRYDLAIKKEYDAKDQLLMVNPLDLFVEVGYGMDFYLTYFKMGIEFKYSIGLFNILRRTDRKGEIPEDIAHYTDYIDSINANMFILSFHFE